MSRFSDVTHTILNWLEGHSEINEVSFGDSNEIDLSTHTNFPLCHVIPLGTVYGGATNTYNYQILFMDQPHDNTTEERIEVLGMMDEVATDFARYLYEQKDYVRASIGSLSGDSIYDEKINRLYGQSLGNVSITVPNIQNCE